VKENKEKERRGKKREKGQFKDEDEGVKTRE